MQNYNYICLSVHSASYYNYYLYLAVLLLNCSIAKLKVIWFVWMYGLKEK